MTRRLEFSGELSADAKILREAILTYVQQMGDASFADLHIRLGMCTDGPLPSRDGDWQLSAPGKPNTVLWAGMSEAFLAAVLSLIDDHELHMRGTQPLVYFADGMSLSLPQAKRPRMDVDYKKPHWLAAILRPGPHPDEDRSETKVRP